MGHFHFNNLGEKSPVEEKQPTSTYKTCRRSHLWLSSSSLASPFCQMLTQPASGYASGMRRRPLGLAATAGASALANASAISPLWNRRCLQAYESLSTGKELNEPSARDAYGMSPSALRQNATISAIALANNRPLQCKINLD